MLLTRRGRGVALLLDLQGYKKLIGISGFIEAAKAGAESAKAGELHKHSEAGAILDSFYENNW